jgi:hypothetical protein
VGTRLHPLTLYPEMTVTDLKIRAISVEIIFVKYKYKEAKYILYLSNSKHSITKQIISYSLKKHTTTVIALINMQSQTITRYTSAT